MHSLDLEPTVVGQSAADRLRQQVRHYARRCRDAEPTDSQVVCVLRALADYAALQCALQWRRDEEDDPALAVGRWLLAVGNQMELEE